jgi:hypothetical protein
LPYTAVGIDIAQLLDGNNLTCGTSPGDISTYAAIVNFYEPPAPLPDAFHCGNYTFEARALLAGGSYPCYAQGTFANLPLPGGGALPDGGSADFTVQIYFFTNAAFEADPGLAESIRNASTPGPRMTAEEACIQFSQLPFAYAATCQGTESDNVIANASCPTVYAAPCDGGGEDCGAPDAGVTDASSDDATDVDSRTNDAGASDDVRDEGRASDAANDATKILDGATDGAAG